MFQPLIHTRVRFGMQKRGREALPALLQPKTRCRCASPANTGPPLRPASCVYTGTCGHWLCGFGEVACRISGAAVVLGASLQRWHMPPPLAGDGRNKWASARAVLPCTRLIRGGGVSGGEPLPLPCPQHYSHFTPVGNPFCLDREDLPPRQGRGELRGWAGRGWPSAGAFERFEGAAFP